MSTPWFFLSYSRVGSKAGDSKVDGHVREFFEKLIGEMRGEDGDLKPLFDHQIGFMDVKSIEAGDDWPQALADALKNCRVLVCLYSDGYFTSEPCGKEFSAFRSRFPADGDEKKLAGKLIVPILWRKPNRPLPPAVRRLQYTDDALGEVYARDGLYAIKTSGDERTYNRLVITFARRIIEKARADSLPPLDGLESFDQIRNAWEEKDDAPAANPLPAPFGASGRPDAGGGTSPPTPKPKRLRLYAAAVICGLLGGAAWWAVSRRPPPSPRVEDSNLAQHLTSHAHYVYPDELSQTESFTAQPGTVCSNSSRWVDIGNWELPDDAWKLEKGPDGDNDDCALVVKGERPGFYKLGEYENFKATFDIRFKNKRGNLAGWYLRASPDGAGGYYGYKFILQRPQKESETFWLISSVRAPGAAQEQEISKCSIVIPGLTRDGHIGVEVRAEGGKFYYTFTLQANISRDPSLLTAGAPTCPVEAKNDFNPAGRLGFFAGDAESVFAIDQVDINGAQAASRN